MFHAETSIPVSGSMIMMINTHYKKILAEHATKLHVYLLFGTMFLNHSGSPSGKNITMVTYDKQVTYHI